MAKSKYTREERHAIAKEANIQFSLEVTSKTKYREVFEQIQELGNVKLAEYHAGIKHDSQDELWKATVLQRARSIKKIINRCYEDRVPEFGWRLSVEKDIFFRFEVEVICRQCSRRVWLADWNKAFKTNELRRGDSTRPLISEKDCTCPKRHWEDRSAARPSKMFGWSVESMVQYQEKDIGVLHTRHQKPDAMYWLYRAGRIEQLLNAPSTTWGKKVGDIVQTRLCESGNANMAFPFLLYEAKSASSADNFDDITLQSSLPIREMLKIQHNLFFDRKERKYVKARPLVWFISSHGHTWNVSGAYAHGRAMGSQITLLWSGNIAQEENALRLLLIVGYICDWARKDYRANVIDQLLHLTRRATSSLRAETELLSLSDATSYVQRCGEFVHGPNPELEEHYLRPSKKELNMAEVLELLDSENIAIRDARYRHFRVCALQIDANNIEDFFLYERSHDAAQARAKALMRCIRAPHAWRVNIGALKALEKFWVGCHIDQTEPGDKEESFLTRFGIHSYIECRPPSRADEEWRPGNWLQVHELSFIAISEGALADLARRSQYRSRRYQIQVQDCPKMPESCLLHCFEQVKGAPARDCITAAMQQRCVVNISCIVSQLPAELEAHDGFYAPGMDVCCDNDELYVIQAPRSVYNRHKIGRKEPSEAFTWKSPKQLESSTPTDSSIQHMEYPAICSNVPKEDSAVLVTNNAGSCCVFLVESKASHKISISQAYNVSTLVAGPVSRQPSLTEPKERDISSWKHRMLAFLNSIVDAAGPNHGRRRSSTLQRLASNSSFLAKIASYLDDKDAPATQPSTVQTLAKSFEQKAREYGLEKLLRGMMGAFEDMADNEGLSESDGDVSIDETRCHDPDFNVDDYTDDETTDDEDEGEDEDEDLEDEATGETSSEDDGEDSDTSSVG